MPLGALWCHVLLDAIRLFYELIGGVAIPLAFGPQKQHTLETMATVPINLSGLRGSSHDQNSMSNSVQGLWKQSWRVQVCGQQAQRVQGDGYESCQGGSWHDT